MAIAPPVRDIHYLSNIERCDGRPETARRARKGGGRDFSELNRRIRTSYRALSVFSIDPAHKRCYKNPEKNQRQRVTNEVEEDESPAESTHVANQSYQVTLTQVMAKVHGECYIRGRQRIASCVGLDYWHWRGNARMWADVRTNYVHAKPVPDLFQDETRGTSYIQDSMYWERIAANGLHNRSCVAQPTVDSGEVPVRLLNQYFGNTTLVKDFGFVFPHHTPAL